MTQVPRPFFSFKVQELEEEFVERHGDIEFLRALIHELGFRSVPKASDLKMRATQALATVEQPAPSRPTPPAATPKTESTAKTKEPNFPLPLSRDVIRPNHQDDPRFERPAALITNAPNAVLDAWTALEVLSPQSFRRPEDLTGGDRRAVATLEDRLPWEGEGEKSRPKKRLYYQVILGTINMGGAVGQLLASYTDSRAERPVARGEAVLAVVLVDQKGRLVESPGAFVSSFAWGVPHALRGDLSVLAHWQKAEGLLVEGLDEILRRSSDDEEEELPLCHATIKAGYEWLVASLGLPPELVVPPRFALRVYEDYKNRDPSEPTFLNSFYLNDLARAKALFTEGGATTNLRRYLGCEAPKSRRDLRQDDSALEAAVAPKEVPAARWPGPGRNSLVLLQQAAVNLAIKELRETGILAVNGPPGTGKTTLLRDLVAGIVTARAEVMAGFEDPATAFSHSGEKLRAGQAWLHLYRLDHKLKGFEMLVASSNNKAVENVSAELPALKSVATEATDLRYLRTLSDELLECETWGLVAAVLGNAANRTRFKNIFWWDKDFGLSTYLAEAAGTPQRIEVGNPDTGKVETRPPRIVSEEKPPQSHAEALQRWGRARARFRKALGKSQEKLKELERIREMAASLPLLERAAKEARKAEANAREVEDKTRISADDARARLSEAQRQAAEAERSLADYDETAPGFIARLFRTRRAREWQAARKPLAEAREHTRAAMSLADKAFRDSEIQHRKAVAEREAAERHRIASVERHESVLQQVEVARKRIGDRFIDSGFFAREHEDKQKTVPWLDDEAQRARDDLFVAAMALHKAFIDVAAKPLRHNLGAMMSVMGGRSLPGEKRALAPDLWSSLFLVVPLISTTFASVERMLGKVPVEGLGWLFVDEAGQALPQAAVGALMRSRRAVVVGDPVQIEPIVVLPDTLTHAICRHFGVDPDYYNAPNASVQTLADAATPCFAEFEGRHGSRKVGVPLLVHRRCAEPMFGISNAVAYEGQMVNSKADRPSPIGEILGPSSWIDIQGSAVEKWCPEEGEAVLSLLRSIAQTQLVPDLYIVTPFLIVADSLRKLVRDSKLLTNWTEDSWKWTSERIGTVHTVQGREAEAVIFVLGAPAPHQSRARNWAGNRPNLLNVAVTRAKERLYVVGNHSLWREVGLFSQLALRLPVREDEE